MVARLPLFIAPLLLASCEARPQASRDLGRELGHADLARDLPAEILRDGRGDLPAVASRFLLLPAGSFQMGSAEDEPCREPEETRRAVTLTRAFELLASEVSEAFFVERMGYRPAQSCGPACPVRQVSWHEAAAFANALSAAAQLPACYTCTGSLNQVSCAAAPLYALTEPGKAIYDCPGYRLPTEAEWEYAYRAGTTTALYSGELGGSCSGADPAADAIAWYQHTSGGVPHALGGKQANAWGLHDLAGNVAEWTHDGFVSVGVFAAQDPLGPSEAHERVVRGGSFASEVGALRAAARARDTPGSRRGDRGFRVARTRP